MSFVDTDGIERDSETGQPTEKGWKIVGQRDQDLQNWQDSRVSPLRGECTRKFEL